MTHRLVEHLFFFGLLGVVAYVMWQIIAPFVGALALAAILATISYPMYVHILNTVSPRKNRSIASLLTILLVTIVILVPISLIVYLLFAETLGFYTSLTTGSAFSLERTLLDIEEFVQRFAPGFSMNLTGYTEQAASWVVRNIQSIFTGAVSTFFLLFLSFIALFYFFKDGKEFTKQLVYLSPLPDDDDEAILRRLGQAVRSVILGALAVAVIQGTITGIGLTIFGFEQAILLGAVAAIGALVPAVGTSIVFVPTVTFLALTGDYWSAAGLALWGALAVGFIDNLLGPYLISRNAPLHPFFILLSVLGGIAFFGPIGFILGPVTLSLFNVLLELYSTHLRPSD